jgi:hypothetical protein
MVEEAYRTLIAAFIQAGRTEFQRLHSDKSAE